MDMQNMEKKPRQRHIVSRIVFLLALTMLTLVISGCGEKTVDHSHLNILSTALVEEMYAGNAATAAAVELTVTAVTEMAPSCQVRRGYLPIRSPVVIGPRELETDHDRPHVYPPK